MRHCMEISQSTQLALFQVSRSGNASQARTFSQRITKIYNDYANRNICSDHPTNNKAEKPPCQSFLILLHRCDCWP
ncbi:protein of unknown function [Cupriavidus neocaledonicus]|uniref:Uncharacterized protein n=1 Tax=Cupriavidus neocaledonicus TaxID=1040979 RepID=A0A375H2N9_9BURK|nr:hypothetical protein CBM2605_A10066 [Cupriavidus neocaledonicus]SPD45108.1 protein of unknown function [Cupriavidus neocaledonicus]